MKQSGKSDSRPQAQPKEVRSRPREKWHHDSISYAELIGYSSQDMRSVPGAAAVTHGCGNPTAIADLKEGEWVLDLGCGGGLDVFLAARRVGARGKVIGLDKSPEMIQKARFNARTGKYANVGFGVAEMEHLPIAACSIDVIISNCVINHAQDKRIVFREAHRVLKPGGRLMVSDLVTIRRLPRNVLSNADPLWEEWLSAASDRQEYLKAVKAAGFRSVEVLAEGPFPMTEADSLLRDQIVAIQFRGVKPRRGTPQVAPDLNASDAHDGDIRSAGASRASFTSSGRGVVG